MKNERSKKYVNGKKDNKGEKQGRKIRTFE